MYAASNVVAVVVRCMTTALEIVSRSNAICVFGARSSSLMTLDATE